MQTKEPFDGKFKEYGLSFKDAWDLVLEIRRSRVRRFLTYAFATVYFALVVCFAYAFLYGSSKPDDAALAFFRDFQQPLSESSDFGLVTASFILIGTNLPSGDLQE